MQLLILSILFIINTSTFGLECFITNDGKFLRKTLHDDFNIEEFLEDFEELDLIDYDDLCRMKIFMSYFDQNLAIAFSQHLGNRGLHNGEVLLTTYVDETQTGDLETTYLLEYACNDDKCEMEFIKKNFQWLFHARYSKLSDELTKFIIRNGTRPRKCFADENEREQCSGHQCVANFVLHENNETVIFQDCVVDENRIKTVGVVIEVFFDTEFENIDVEINFFCEYNLCNSHNIVAQIENIIDREYNPNGVLQVFGYKGESQQKQSTITITTMKSTTQKSETSTLTSINIRNTTTPNNNARRIINTMSMNNLTLLTFIFYFIFCI